MHNDFLYLFLYIFIFYITGFAFIFNFFPMMLKKHSLFVNIGLSWAVGNFVAVVLLYTLAFVNQLAILTPFNLSVTFIILSVIFLFSFDQKRKQMIAAFQTTQKINFIMFLLFLIFFFSLLQNALFSYLIDWDAVAFWFLKAKVFFYAGGVWHTPFFNDRSLFQYAHKAYPIGFPLLIAGYYTLINRINDQAVQLYISMFYLNLIFIFYGFFRERMRMCYSITLFLITISFLIFPYMIIYAHNGYADIPLSFIFTLCLILFIYQCSKEKNVDTSVYRILIFMISGLGATIKNEGIAFFIIINIASIVVLFFNQTIKKHLLSMKRILVTTILSLLVFIPLGLWHYFKLFHHIETDSYLHDAQFYYNMLPRVKFIVNLYLNEIINTSKYGVMLTPALFLFVVEYTFLIIAKKIRFLIPSFVLIAQLGVYTLIYAITNVPLDWQVLTSFDRLALHLIPGFFVVLIYQFTPTQEVIKNLIEQKKKGYI